ncbi:MAG: hypothetical protein ACE5HS_14370, partial [bacterium]
LVGGRLPATDLLRFFVQTRWTQSSSSMLYKSSKQGKYELVVNTLYKSLKRKADFISLAAQHVILSGTPNQRSHFELT